MKEKGFTVGKTGVIAVEVGDHPGGLQAILQVFETAGVNVEYMYAFVQKNSENATLIFRLDRIEYALEELKKILPCCPFQRFAVRIKQKRQCAGIAFFMLFQHGILQVCLYGSRKNGKKSKHH